jgi:hypothetical protein
VRPVLLTAVALLVAGAVLTDAFATAISPGDRVRSLLIAPGDEGVFTFEAGSGDQLSAKVKAGKAGDLLPDPVLVGPDEVERDLAGFLVSGGGKAQLRGYVLDQTGTWALLVRGEAGTSGPYDLATKLKPLKGAKYPGRNLGPGGSADYLFAARSGTVVRVKVKVRTDGGSVEPLALLDPSMNPVPGFDSGLVEAKGGFKGEITIAGQFGDYRLRLGGAPVPTEYDITWKVRHPRTAREKLDLPARPATDYLDQLLAADHAPDGTLDDVVLIDTRTQEDYDAYHLPGAIHHTYEELVGWEGPLPWGPETRLVFYCYGFS